MNLVMIFRGYELRAAVLSYSPHSPSGTIESAAAQVGSNLPTHPDPPLPLLWDVIENDIALVVLEVGKVPLHRVPK